MPNFSIALTGLQADTVALNTIGNNLANLNTTAFKKETTTFEDLFYQNVGTTGAGDQLQVGAGTRVAGTTNDFTQGSLSTTGSQTDMALDGNGFFVVQQGGVQSLTRAGDFQTDNQGNLITSDGRSVMGYGATGGTVQAGGALIARQIPEGATEAAQATTNIGLTTSLDSSALNNARFTSPVTIYDSLGASHQATVTYTKNSANTWGYSVTLPAGDATGTPVNNTGTLQFDPSGNLVSPAANVTGMSFPGLVDGAADLTVNFNLFTPGGTPTVTQTAAASNTSATTQDGFTSGSYQSFTVDATGTIEAQFSNHQTRVIGQVAVATVTNTEGLIRTGDNDFAETAASGSAVLGVAGTGGRASIDGQAVEVSNVDISAEFSDLIVAQRAFEANSKTVTTFDQVTETAIGMLR